MKKTKHISKRINPSPLGGEMERGLVIGITDCSKWKNYHNWFASKDVNVIKLSPKENNVSDVDKCNGIVLSGGEDVHPKYYGKPSYWKKRKELKLEVNEARDKFELRVIARAMKNKKPILGICRGLQITNVYFKGTLIPDLKPILNPCLTDRQASQREGLAVRHAKNDGYDQLHNIEVEKDSCLQGIISISHPNGGSWRGAVNSAHHQAADKIGKGLKVSARAEDGTVESLEYKNPKSKPFLLLVQWHPERMKDQKSSFAKNILKKFLQEAKKK